MEDTSMSITSQQCFARYGAPEHEKNMVVYQVPVQLAIGSIPKKIYCNADMKPALEKALENVIQRGLIDQIKTWDGCFNIRRKRGASSQSLHSWGLAIDINAAWNGFNKPPTMSRELVDCFTSSGFEWGGDWKGTKDGMHFQLAKVPV